MKTDTYVKYGKLATDHLGPINATMVIATGTLLPIMDFFRPYFPYINHLAGMVVFFFLVLFIIKMLNVLPNRVIPSSMVFCAGVCAVAFSVGAVASSKHATEGGFIAAKSEDARAIQFNLLNIEKQTADINKRLDGIQSGKSSNPRVELANMGIQWEFINFTKAAIRGDERVVELFLQGGMPVVQNPGQYFQSIPYFVVDSSLSNSPKMLEIFFKNGVNLNDPALVPSWGHAKEVVPPNLYAVAMMINKPLVAKKLIELGVDNKSYESWKLAKDEYDKKPKAVLFGI